MKWKQFMAGFMAGALVVSSLAPAAKVSAAEPTNIEDALVASYDFDDETLSSSVADGDAAAAIVTGLGNYTGTVTYGEGQDGTKAVRLGDYGLELGQDNLGENFTISMSLKAEGTIANNQAVVFLGYHSPENWYAVAGRDSNNIVKAWAYGGGYQWTEFGTLTLGYDWHDLIITGDAENIKIYLDNALVATADTNNPLSGGNQDIYIGVNNWDPEFVGLVDDVKVYNATMSEEEITASTRVDDVEAALVAFYDFEDGTLSNAKAEGDEASAIVTGLGSYTGTVEYADGRNGKAVRLGDYGLKLNQNNLGQNFTVSYWLQAEGTIAANQSVAFLGYHSPELWYAVAGRNSNNVVKMWARGNGYSWTEFGTMALGYDWHNITITGDAGSIKTYLDGTLVSSTGSNNPLNGTNQDIYIGVTNWDPEFAGLVDDIKVYNATLTEEQIQQQDKDAYESMLQAKLDAITEEDLLGSNESADAVGFDLILPEELDGNTIAWTSSDTAVITADGTVTNPEADTKVTMTATVTTGILTATKTFEFTVKPLDRTSLDELIAKAESLNLEKYEEATVDALAAALDEALAADSYVKVAAATANLHEAISGLVFVDEYVDPFAAIDEQAPTEAKVMDLGTEEQLFTLPESVKDMVTVEYFSSDDASATYVDGKVTALKEGRVTVTAIVTAKYDGSVEEYSTALNIGGEEMEVDQITPVGSVSVSAAAQTAADLTEPTEGPVTIRESEINQLLTEDLALPTDVDGAAITYSVDGANARYVVVEGTTLKVTRPYAGAGNYKFVLTAEVEVDGETVTQQFPLTIAEGITADTYAGYVYLCFGNQNGADVQQVHMFLSEDGLNWTALNGFNPIFEAGTDYADLLEEAGTHNYTIKEGADISATTSGDASVLFPFEGDDQGIRDPYILRGAREEDSNKVWILATDLNTMSSQYGGSLANNAVGNWGTMSSRGSTSIFVYETEDWIHWERRYIDVGSEIGAGAAWAPEAVYNPEKDNYLVYWSCRVTVDGLARNRVYCNETKDFVTFGPTKLYEQEDNYKDWGTYLNGNDGYGNIDTSQLWVADENGNPYGTLFRVVKDETDNHIELKSAKTVLDPNVDYDNTNPIRITPYTYNGTEYATASDLSGLNDYQKAEVVWNWFAAESTGDHFTDISQSYMESRNETNGAFEGATMFKFNDRDEWCIMIDNYSSSSIRYEPYVTTDLSEPDSITKVTSGYGRTGGDVGCHGGMMPITAAEYNTLIDAYNSDPTVDNYHPIHYIEGDKRELEEIEAGITAKLAEEGLSDEVRKILEDSLVKVESMLQTPIVSSEAAASLSGQVSGYLNPVEIAVSETEVTLTAGESAAVNTESTAELTWYSADTAVATVENGTITAVGEGSTFVFVRVDEYTLAKIKVVVTAAAEHIYEDVAETDWFYDAAYYNYDEKLMIGLTETTFGPYVEFSRAQMALILYRMDGEPEVAYSDIFSDVEEGAWYADAIMWAQENGIVTGYGGTDLFGPHDLVSREQIAVMMYRYAIYKGYDTTATADLGAFTDGDSVSGYSEEAVKWAVGSQILLGKSGGTHLAPQDKATRAEGALIIQRFMENCAK